MKDPTLWSIHSMLDPCESSYAFISFIADGVPAATERIEAFEVKPLARLAEQWLRRFKPKWHDGGRVNLKDFVYALKISQEGALEELYSNRVDAIRTGARS